MSTYLPAGFRAPSRFLMSTPLHGWMSMAAGAETIAHLRENGRVTVMFCAFDGRPNIVRLHGTGRVVSRYDRADYRITKNRTSIDGLAAYDFDAAEPAEPSVQG